MAEHIEVAPDELRQAARHHQDTAEQLSAASGSHGDVLASLESLGPIFAELRDAGRELLEQRRSCYEQQAVAHSELAAKLQRAADIWELQDSAAAAEFRRITEGGT
ncbi:ESX-1 secretion-associated protein [Mycolicibacterium sp. CH28]|uniref:ESX-1 secretion-associated protein n=1 Tax=Mycolicibacterium sp. CH28 TaxID=2512237 RepID=UPI00107FDA2C|nr:ESX-1 secretion-associated protein [Mycolicibacterium sp. CH28]TGD90040.1 ESX-1 secretion-associated protein [Mycolicibacterium sp. CH28]